jgi:hypothetical protein
MVVQGKWQGCPLTISVKANCLTISIERPSGADVYSFDYAGRMWTALVERVSYRRGLDGKIVAKWQEAGGAHQRRWLVGAPARRLEESARQTAADLYQDLNSGAAVLDAPLSEAGRLGFQHAIAYNQEQAAADIAAYHQVYRPVGILPPDQYFAVVLQAAEGCSFNTCTFCNFYKDRPFRIKGQDEFYRHAQAVRDFLGQGLSLRRTIFLGDANALVIPMPRLLPLMETVHQVYDVEKLGGMYAFLDGFSGEKKSTRDYQTLAEAGLKRVYIGMESGSPELLKFLRKPGEPGDVLRAVQALKEGGVAVGVIVLLGAGGQVYARQHVSQTIQALNAMPLDLEDIIYFSELVLDEGLQYVKDAYLEQLQPLSAQERLEQAQAIEDGLRFSPEGGIPHISRYDIREFVY